MKFHGNAKKLVVSGNLFAAASLFSNFVVVRRDWLFTMNIHCFVFIKKNAVYR